MQKKSIDVLFILFDIGLTLENSTVFQSQVGDQIIALQEMNFKIGLLATYNDLNKFNSLIGNKLREKGVEVVLVQNTSFIHTFSSMSSVLRKCQNAFHINFCYVRGLWGPLIIKWASFFSTIPYIYDVRGDLSDEIKSINTNSVKRFIYLQIEKWGISKAYRVTAVTNALAEIVMNRFSKAIVSVIPCCINYDQFVISEQARFHKRKELGFNESDVVMVYSGGLSHYQQVPKMMELWRKFASNQNVRFLLLTNEDPHSHPVTIDDIGFLGDKIIHKSIPRDQVPEMLAVADIAFMLRESRALNRAASPVKFPEYLAAGLAIVASPSTGDISDIIEINKIGVLVDVNDLSKGFNGVNELIQLLESSEGKSVKQRAKNIAKTTFNWMYYENTYSNLYNKNII